MKIWNAVFLLMLASTTVLGGGGLVGNSPMAVSFQAPPRFPWPSEVEDEDKPGDTKASSSADEGALLPPAAPAPAVKSCPLPAELHPRRNGLLLREGEARLLLGFGLLNEGRFGSSVHETGKLGFDYGLSDNWTLLNLTTLGYNLWGHGGRGHELALLFGLVGGFELHSSKAAGYRVRFEPGTSLLYSYTNDGWRFVGALTLSSVLTNPSTGASSNYLKDYSARLRTGLSRNLGELWSVGLAAESYVYSSDLGSGRETDTRWLIAKPSLSVSRRIGSNAVLTYMLGVDDKSGPVKNWDDGLGNYFTLAVQW